MSRNPLPAGNLPPRVDCSACVGSGAVTANGSPAERHEDGAQTCGACHGSGEQPDTFEQRDGYATLEVVVERRWTIEAPSRAELTRVARALFALSRETRDESTKRELTRVMEFLDDVRLARSAETVRVVLPEAPAHV